jgi:putative DNA primase/helicase
VTARPNVLNAALAFAAQGIPVFPLNGKVPAKGSAGFKDATTDPATIRARFTPGMNVGIPTGAPSGLVVLDADSADGEQALAEVCGGTLPQTRTHRTGRGRHFLFAYPGQPVPSRAKLRPGLDVRGDGGYIVAPPSVHPDTGTPYTVEDADVPVAPLPDALRTLLVGHEHNTRTQEEVEDSTTWGPGERNDRLTRLAGAARRQGASAEAILALLTEVNGERCDPPLSDRELAQIARSVGRYAEVPSATDDDRSRFTDLGNARQLIADHGADLLHVPGVGWLVWDGCRFAPDQTGAVHRRAKATVRAMLVRAAALTDDDQRKRAIVHALASHSAGRIRAMVELAATEPEVIASPDDLDTDPLLLNCLNGTLDLRTRTLRPHERADRLTKLAPVRYDPAATAPRWEAFLHRVVPVEAIRTFLQRATGYSCTGLTDDQCLFLLYGLGANGKSTFLETLAGLLGDYGQAMNFVTLTTRTRAGQGPSEDVARLRGARYVTAVETGEGVAFNEPLLKQLTGGDRINARFLHRNSFDFRPQFKLWLAANHKPTITGTDDAIWRRIHLIPFTEQIPEAERIRDLPRQLQAEASGILNWILIGLGAWQTDGLGLAEQVRAATKRYREEQDAMRAFLAARCVVDAAASVGATALYEAYADWAEAEDQRPESLTAFGRRLSDLGFGKARRQDGARGKVWVRLGLALKPEDL